MSSQGGLKHVSTEPSQLANKRERRRGPTGRAAVLRRAPSDSDCSGETASLSADSAERAPRAPPPAARSGKTRSSRSFYSRRRGSEWEVLEGLKDGQRFEKRPEVFNGYLHKKRKWPLKGWHKRFFVIDGGILVYARSPTDVARGRLHGSVDVGLSVISAKQRRRRIDIDADEFIYHLRAKTPDVYRTWLTVLKAHRLYRQHLLTFGARESAPKIHAPLEDLPPTDTSSRGPVFLLSSTSYSSSTSDDRASETPNDSVIYLTLEGNKGMYSIQPKTRIPDVFSKSMTMESLDTGYKTMRRCFTTNWLYKDCYSWVDERMATEKYFHYPVLCSTEFSFASRDSTKPRFNEKRYLCAQHMEMQEDPSKSCSFYAVRKSKKCTNVKRYQIINVEPRLPGPESQCVILKKYIRKRVDKDKKYARKDHNVDNYRVIIRKKQKNQKINTVSTSSFESITKNILTSLLEIKDSEQHADRIKASVKKAVKRLYKGSHLDQPVKQLFRSLLEFYLSNTGYCSPSVKETISPKKSKVISSQTKISKDVHLSTSYIDTKTKGTQIQKLLNQICDAKETLLNAIYKSETVQKNVSTRDKNLSGFYPVTNISKEIQIEDFVDKTPVTVPLSSYSKISNSSSCQNVLNARKYKNEHSDLSSKLFKESEAMVKHQITTVNPLATILKRKENRESEQEMETVIHNTVYTCQTVDHDRNCRESTVTPKDPNDSNHILNKEKVFLTSSYGNSDQASPLSCKLHIGDNVERKSKESQSKRIQLLKGLLETNSDVHQVNRETETMKGLLDTISDVHQINHETETKLTSVESKHFQVEDYVKLTKDKSVNGNEYSTSATNEIMLGNLSQKLRKTVSIVVNNLQSLNDEAGPNNIKPEMLSKHTSLNQLLLVISSVFSEVNKMCSSSQTKLSTDSNDNQKEQIFSVKDTDSLSTKVNCEESNENDIHDVLVELRKVFSQDKMKQRSLKCEPYTYINKHVMPAMYPMVDKLPKVVIVDVKESKIHKNPIKQYQTPTNCFLMNDYSKKRQYSTLNSTNNVKEDDNQNDDLKNLNELLNNRIIKTKRSTYTAKVKNIRRCIPKPRVNFEKSREEKPLPKYMDETFIQLLLENMDLILNNLPDAYKDLYAKLSQTSDYSVEIDLLRKMYKKVIASTDKEAQFDSKIQLLKDTIDVFTEVSNNLLKRQVEDKNVSANASTVDLKGQTSRKPSQPNNNLDLEKILCDQNLSASVLTFDGMGQTSRKLSQVYKNLDLQKVYSSKTEQTCSSILYSNLNFMNQFSEKKSLIPSSLHQEFLKLRSSTQYEKRKNEKTFVNVQNVKVEKNTFNVSDSAQLNCDISTVTTLNKFSSTMLSPRSFPERYMKPSKTASAIVIDTNEEIIRIEEIQKVTDYEELPKTYLVVIASNKKHRRRKCKDTTSIKKLLLRTPPPTPVKISTEIQTSKTIKRNKKPKSNYIIFRNAATSDNEPPVIDKSSDINTIYRCTSESSYFSGLISPTSPPIRGPQAGFVSGTPGGRLASWIIESGGPLENASKELGQAQLSVQQLQRLLDALELQQQVHHDTDVSLEGASPNVKKDRRKFGLRKKKSNSKCASVELAPPQHIDPSSSHMALSTLTAPPSPGGGASSAPNSAASLPIACAAARPQSLPGPDSICGAGGPASLTSLTPDHQLREDFTVLAKDLVANLKSIVGTLVCERGRLRAAMDAGDTSSSPGGAMVAALRTNLSSALQQNSELRNRLSRIHDASDLAEISSMGHNSDPIARQFQASLSYSSSCVSASEFFDAEEHEEDDAKQEMIAADETGVIELDGDSSSEVGSLSSEEGSASSDNSDGALLSAEQVTLRLNENGLEPATLKSAGWTRRKRLPCPRPTPGGPSLWNLLYKNIGKDLSQISMPVTINEPLNMLQRLCEELEYSELLDAAAECRSPIERMALIAAFAVSAYAAAAHRAASKPFNPLLGETYECVRDDKGFRFIAEQVSHHPPISACHAESPRWCLWQEARIKTKFWGKSMEFQPAGRVHVRLLSTGDHYSWNKVTTCVHNLFGGQRWVDQYGDMHITCHGTDIACKLNFIKASSWSTTRHEVRGAVTQPSTGARLRLQGRWSEALHAGEPPAARCLWRPGAMPPEHELYYGFTRFAMELNELEPGMRDLLPHTDTRLRPDQRALEEGDVDAAEQYKHQLEQSQRERRRDSPEHQPRWFRKSQEGGEEMWVFGNEYWKAREAGFHDNAAPNIW